MTTLQINGKSMKVDAPDDTPLLWVLRDHLGLTGTKFGCGMALCGACTVHLDGVAARSCQTPLSAAVGQEDHDHRRRRRHARRQGGAERLDGDRRAAVRLLPGRADHECDGAARRRIPKPSDADIDGAMSGNLCRCGTYTRIRSAIKVAAGMKGEA